MLRWRASINDDFRGYKRSTCNIGSNQFKDSYNIKHGGVIKPRFDLTNSGRFGSFGTCLWWPITKNLTRTTHLTTKTNRKRLTKTQREQHEDNLTRKHRWTTTKKTLQLHSKNPRTHTKSCKTHSNRKNLSWNQQTSKSQQT